MPFQSEQQRKFMYAKHPEIAKRWSKEFPTQKKLPQYKKSAKKVAYEGIMKGLSK